MNSTIQSSDEISIRRSFPVLNMTCASCANSIQTMLRKQPGVIDTAVNYASEIATVEFIPTLIAPNDLKHSLQSIGYDLIIEDDVSANGTLEELNRAHLSRLKINTIGSVVLSALLIVVSMFLMNVPYANYMMWVLSTPVIVVFGRQFFIGAYKQAVHRYANMDTLVALSTGVAYSFSIFNTVFPEFWNRQGLKAHVYFETAAVVISFILLGKLLEERAKGNTAAALKKLIGLQPKNVTIVQADGNNVTTPLSDVMIGDIVLIKPGEKIPVDGTITAGSSFVDESMISGEPVAVEKKTTDKVFAGTLNQKGSFEFRTDKVGSETLLAQIIKMVQDAQGSKAPVQNLVDKIAGVFVPVVIAIALFSFLAWFALGGENGFTQGLLAFVTVLVIACPCALGLATPTAIMVGVGKAAENGILIKNAESLEQAEKINAVVLDKTGTLTEGRPAVTDLVWAEGNDHKRDILASIEKQSEHPLAEAIVNYLTQVNNVTIKRFESITGFGAKATVNDTQYLVGNGKLLLAKNVILPRPSNWKQIAGFTKPKP